MTLTRPLSLPESYSRLWQALSRMDEKIGSRQRLAAVLRVSTHTIQRILVDGNVPAVETVSRRQSLAWARTLARLAYGLDVDPVLLLKSIGYRIDSELSELVDSELCKLDDEEFQKRSPALTLAEILLDVLRSDGSLRSEHLKKALDGYIELNSRISRLRASDAGLRDGSYCRSCLAALDSDSTGSGEYCRWCSNADGSLKPRSEVLEIMTEWFQSWQNDIDRSEARRRAESYMQAMPAWNR